MQSHTHTKALLSSDPGKAEPFRPLAAPLCCALPALNAMFSPSLAPWQIKESTLWIQFNWGGDRKHSRAIFSQPYPWTSFSSNLQTPRSTGHKPGQRSRRGHPHKHQILSARKHFGAWRRGEGWNGGRAGGREIKKPQQERKMDVQLPGGSADVCVWCTRPGEAVGAAAKDWEVIKACTSLSTIFPVRGVPKVAPMPGCAARCCWLVLLLQLEQQGMQSGRFPPAGAAPSPCHPILHLCPGLKLLQFAATSPLGKWPRYSCAWQTHLFYSGDSLPSMTSISLSFNLD